VLSILALTLAQAAPTTIQVPADYPTLQLAINAAGSGDTIVVAPGTYPESILFTGKALTMMSSGGPQVTTIDGSGFLKSVITLNTGGLFPEPECTIQGFTITGGDTLLGGGIHAATSLTVDDCIFVDNMGVEGGGIYVGDISAFTATNCSFVDNHATQWGGGIRVDNRFVIMDVDIDDCFFRENSAISGGGVYISRHSTDYAIRRCTFLNNEATSSGGALQLMRGAGLTLGQVIGDCVFAGNQAGSLGGAIYDQEADDLIINCTFYGNDAGSRGGGLIRIAGTTEETTISNCIFWENTASTSGAQIEGDGPLQHNLIQGASPSLGVGTINQAPGFRGAGSNDFRLRAGSPCIDAGDTTLVTSTLDILGLPRTADDLGTPDTGVGVAPMVDLGANEFQGDSTGQVPAVILNSGPLQANQFASLKAIAMPPGQPTWLFATSLGNGPTFVPALEVYLDLTNPRSYFTARPSDMNGEVVWDFTMPPGASGRTIFFQVAQFQLKTAILTETVL
jgi:predicted outer membrane repeat protein